MMSLNPNDIAILSIKDFNYCCSISLISKNKAINFIQNADFIRNSKTFFKKRQLEIF